MILKLALLTLVTAVVTACWNEGAETEIRLGDVSIGQQMIDLKSALEQEAITEEEYEATKKALLSLGAICDLLNDDSDDDSDGESDDESDGD